MTSHLSARALAAALAPSLLVAAVTEGLFVADAFAGEVCPCLGDLDSNGAVDGADIATLLGAWGPCGACAACPADLTGDCTVDAADLAITLGAWGACGAVPANDLCSNAKVITAFTGSANPFCTIGASTDGPAISGCSAPSFSGIEGDVWFRVTAPLTCTLQVGICADFDVRVAAYGEGVFGGCACPGGPFGAPLLECAGTESFVVCGLGAAMLVPVEAGDCITLRVGGAPGQFGSGHVDINIYVPPCEIESSVMPSVSGLEAFTEFGICADMSGDFAVVGAIFDDFIPGGTNAGTARVYAYDGSAWVPDQTLSSDAPFSSQRFGVSAAISGQRIIVGAGDVEPGCLADPDCATGEAFVFEHDGREWTLVDSLLPSAGWPEDSFGSRVDIDGTRAIVSAWDDSDNGSFAGAAYVYERFLLFGTPFWFESEKLLASDGDAADTFGSDVAVSGTWALVGADGDESGGAAYLFEDTGADWPQRAKLKPAGLASGSSFGYAVALDGPIAAIGAPQFNGNGAGRVYIYENFGALGWLHTATLTAHDGASGDQFGFSVSISGNQLLVGANGDNGFEGSAYLFWRVNGGWVERARLTGGSTVAGDGFGVAVAIDGGRGIVGAYLDDVGVLTDRGSIYRFHGLGECTGNGVADACDIDDGLADSDDDGVPDICE